jgi:hypothetical protein
VQGQAAINGDSIQRSLNDRYSICDLQINQQVKRLSTWMKFAAGLAPIACLNLG